MADKNPIENSSNNESNYLAEHGLGGHTGGSFGVGASEGLAGLTSALSDISGLIRTALTHPAGTGAASVVLGNKLGSIPSVFGLTSGQGMKNQIADYENLLNLQKEKLLIEKKFEGAVKDTYYQQKNGLLALKESIRLEEARFNNYRNLLGVTTAIGFSIANTNEQMQVAGTKLLQTFSAGGIPGNGTGNNLKDVLTKFQFDIERQVSEVQGEYGLDVSNVFRKIYPEYRQTFKTLSPESTEEELTKVITNMAVLQTSTGIGGNQIMNTLLGQDYANIPLAKKLAFINELYNNSIKGAKDKNGDLIPGQSFYGAIRSQDLDSLTGALLNLGGAAGFRNDERLNFSTKILELFGTGKLTPEATTKTIAGLSQFFSSLEGTATLGTYTGLDIPQSRKRLRDDPYKYLQDVYNFMTERVGTGDQDPNMYQIGIAKSLFGGIENVRNFQSAFEQLNAEITKSGKNTKELGFSINQLDVNNLEELNQQFKLPPTHATAFDKISNFLKQKKLDVEEGLGTEVGYGIGTLSLIASLLLAFRGGKRGNTAATLAGLMTAIGLNQFFSGETSSPSPNGSGLVDQRGNLISQSGPGGSLVGDVIDQVPDLLLLQQLMKKTKIPKSTGNVGFQVVKKVTPWLPLALTRVGSIMAAGAPYAAAVIIPATMLYTMIKGYDIVKENEEEKELTQKKWEQSLIKQPKNTFSLPGTKLWKDLPKEEQLKAFSIRNPNREDVIAYSNSAIHYEPMNTYSSDNYGPLTKGESTLNINLVLTNDKGQVVDSTQTSINNNETMKQVILSLNISGVTQTS